MKLRTFQESDWPRAAELLMSRAVSRTYMIPDFDTPGAARPLFDRLAKLSQDSTRFVRAMEEQGEFVGFLNDVEMADGTIELGYAVSPDRWGRGFATEALKLAIGELFRLGFREVVAGAFEENPASLRVMEKAGMMPLAKTDTIEYRGKTHTCIYRSIKA